jgi:hypothetical protein
MDASCHTADLNQFSKSPDLMITLIRKRTLPPCITSGNYTPAMRLGLLNKACTEEDILGFSYNVKRIDEIYKSD